MGGDAGEAAGAGRDRGSRLLRHRLLHRRRLLRSAHDIDALTLVDRLVIRHRRWWRRRYRALVHGALDAEIAESHQKMDAVRAILTTGGNITRFDATKQDTEREI